MYGRVMWIQQALYEWIPHRCRCERIPQRRIRHQAGAPGRAPNLAGAAWVRFARSRDKELSAGVSPQRRMYVSHTHTHRTRTGQVRSWRAGYQSGVVGRWSWGSGRRKSGGSIDQGHSVYEGNGIGIRDNRRCYSCKTLCGLV